MTAPEHPPAPAPDPAARMMAAYGASRSLFDRMEAGQTFQRALHTQNARLIAYRRRLLPFRTDAHEVVVLVGALARLSGGQTLGEVGDPITVADLTGAWCEALLAAAGLAALHTLAIGPILDIAHELVGDYATTEHVNILAPLADVCAVAGARPETLPRGDDGIEAMRRAVFAGLGQALSCAWHEFHRMVGAARPVSRDETPALYFAGAVDMLIGAPRPGDSNG